MYYTLSQGESIDERRFIILAGIPATMQWSGMSFTTTALAPITTSFPIFTPPITFAPQHTVTSSPIVGHSSSL